METVEKILLRPFIRNRDTYVRCNLNRADKARPSVDSLKRAENHGQCRHPYLDYALEIEDYNYLKAVEAFKKGWIQVQDVSSMLVAEVGSTRTGQIYCMDVCAAPGGKALHLADKLKGSGFVEARDLTDVQSRTDEGKH